MSSSVKFSLFNVCNFIQHSELHPGLELYTAHFKNHINQKTTRSLKTSDNMIDFILL